MQWLDRLAAEANLRPDCESPRDTDRTDLGPPAHFKRSFSMPHTSEPRHTMRSASGFTREQSQLNQHVFF